MFSVKTYIPSLLVLTFALFTNLAYAAEWELLGKKIVNDRTEVDIITVGAGKGEFRRLRLDANHAAVEFKRIVVTFANGNTQTIERNLIVRKKGSGVVLDLKGGERRIRKVKLVYEAFSPGFRKATVTLYGK